MHSYAFIKKCFTLISKPGKDIKEKRKTSNRKRDKEKENKILVSIEIEQRL